MKALIVVDVQKDFLPGGALAVPDGDAIVPLINNMMHQFDCVVATQDWHPEDHGSFAANHEGSEVGETIELDGLSQILWPTHCVQESGGAAFAEGLATEKFDAVFKKGTRPEIDSYSGFHDNGKRHSTGLGDWLRERGVTGVTVVGLATDYCVKFTALDAVAEGFETVLAPEACRGVDLAPGDVDRALEEMAEVGVAVGYLGKGNNV